MKGFIMPKWISLNTWQITHGFQNGVLNTAHCRPKWKVFTSDYGNLSNVGWRCLLIRIFSIFLVWKSHVIEGKERKTATVDRFVLCSQGQKFHPFFYYNYILLRTCKWRKQMCLTLLFLLHMAQSKILNLTKYFYYAWYNILPQNYPFKNPILDLLMLPLVFRNPGALHRLSTSYSPGRNVSPPPPTMMAAWPKNLRLHSVFHPVDNVSFEHHG